jgi:hypothetical protein
MKEMKMKPAIPTSALIACLILSINVSVYAQSSGLLLGIRYTKNRSRGLYVQSTMDGYSADGILRRGDVLLRIADENGRIFNINSGSAIEYAKATIGRNTQAEVEIRRRYQDGSTELRYYLVVFQPIGGLPAGQRPRGVYGAAAVATFSESDGSFFERAGASDNSHSNGNRSSRFFNR